MIEKKFTIFKNFTILIVDDDISLVEDLKVVLKFFFKEVITASNGLDGFKIFQTMQIDVIFSDYVMPKMDGASLFKKIREIDSNIPLVMLSNYSDSEKLLSLIDLKLSGYIIKPYTFENITNILTKVVVELEKIDNANIYFNENIYFDRKAKILYSNQNEIKLTKNELTLVELFVKNPNQIIHQETIDYYLNPNEPLSYQSSKNVIYRLRKKLGVHLIQNIQSVGYIFKPKTVTKENR